MTARLVHAWRHPRAEGGAGCCIGRTDLPVDPRKAKRLAHRIRAFARRARLPHIVVTSPLRRSCEVGCWLARWGWTHRVDPALAELDFGTWEGRGWASVPVQEIDAWCADFVHHAPGGGESLAALLRRVERFEPAGACVVVTHGGWLSAAAWLTRGAVPATSERWPPPPSFGQRVALAWSSVSDARRPGRQALGRVQGE
ncbi:histidine phosphatase family protein [Piscinibacter koreensis]|uniref:Histidine phosphatase family protein n=1 Tax=Piscinibacter koreensis TaxID=2742824 RepID=A0A7Y6TX66_9BURK|nr:histidine phosphatase family protein [Schlegelella koreensis]NUZ06782.1 histidine phosphatase family protein [Schlegelella koreensis]